jgi:hypothetical protein
MSRHQMNSDTSEQNKIRVTARQYGQHRAPTSVKARLALWLSLSGFCTFGALSVVSLFLSIAALVETELNCRNGHTRAWVALWLSIAGLAVGSILVIGGLTS